MLFVFACLSSGCMNGERGMCVCVSVEGNNFPSTSPPPLIHSELAVAFFILLFSFASAAAMEELG